jgi:hypothetical protein
MMAIMAAMMAIFPMTAANAADQGAKQIDIFGGHTGNVPFPHAQHQDRIKDCEVCHSVFPQETGAIKKLKEAGKLKKKKVMNLQCIKCHKQEKRAGKPHGPLTCKTCHVK